MMIQRRCSCRMVNSYASRFGARLGRTQSLRAKVSVAVYRSFRQMWHEIDQTETTLWEQGSLHWAFSYRSFPCSPGTIALPQTCDHPTLPQTCNPPSQANEAYVFHGSFLPNLCAIYAPFLATHCHLSS